MELEPQQPNAMDPVERFNNRYEVDEETGCWLWTGYVKDGTGYGEMSVNGSNYGAHRISYTIRYGDIPDGDWVLHKCHNKTCVNPEHLYLGDVKANVQDSIEEGSFWNGVALNRGEDVDNSKLTEDDVREIKRLKRDTDMTHKEVAERFETTPPNITAILNGRSWSHVTLE